MDRMRLGWTLVVIGIVLAFVSAFAELLGLGDDDGFGMQQVAGIVVGVVIAVIGAAIEWGLRRSDATTVHQA